MSIHVDTEKLLQLADYLETVPPESFDLDGWVIQDERAAIPPTMFCGIIPITKGDPGCGFAGCALGWAAHSGLFPGLTLQNRVPVYRGASQYASADRLFGFDQATPKRNRLKHHRRDDYEYMTSMSLFLFCPSMYKRGSEPAQVADRIRRVVAKLHARRVRKSSEPKLRLVASGHGERA